MEQMQVQTNQQVVSDEVLLDEVKVKLSNGVELTIKPVTMGQLKECPACMKVFDKMFKILAEQREDENKKEEEQGKSIIKAIVDEFSFEEKYDVVKFLFPNAVENMYPAEIMEVFATFIMVELSKNLQSVGQG